jgi:hypothetical protein
VILGYLNHLQKLGISTMKSDSMPSQEMRCFGYKWARFIPSVQYSKAEPIVRLFPRCFNKSVKSSSQCESIPLMIEGDNGTMESPTQGGPYPRVISGYTQTIGLY